MPFFYSVSPTSGSNLLNSSNSLVTAEFLTEAALGLYPEYDLRIISGRNSDIGTATTPEDVWEGGGDYTGLNPTVAGNMEAVSDSTADVGTLVSSGTSTGGNQTELDDSGATFVTDGVVAGDFLINDTLGIHGNILSVTETKITVWRMEGDLKSFVQNQSGNSYRVVTAGSTGASVLRIPCAYDGNMVHQGALYTILNGTTEVSIAGSYLRSTIGEIVHSGTGGGNAGVVTLRQEATPANVFFSVPVGRSNTAVMAFSVDAGKVALVKRLRLKLARNTGADGAAVCTIRYREFGSRVFKSSRPLELTSGSDTSFTSIGGDLIPPGADVKFRVEEVSDNLSIVEGALEYILIDERSA